MAELENCKIIKKNCKSRLTKFKTFLEKYTNSTNKESVPIEEIQLRIKKAEETWEEFDKAQTSLQLLFPAQDWEAERTEFEEIYYRYISIANQCLNQRLTPNPVAGNSNNATLENSQSARIAQLESELRAQRESELAALRDLASSRASASESNNRSRYPLPKLNLPIFSGGYKEWLAFRDAFTAIIINDETIPKTEKLRYLRSYLSDEALRAISNLEPSGSNFGVAWDLLIERYDNQKMIIQNHMQALFELPAVTRDSAASLRNLLDDALNHIRALKVLEEPTEKWDTPLIYLIVSKLDRETRKEWEKSITSTKRPEFDKLSKFLRERCQILETMNYKVSDKQKTNEPTNKFNNERKHSLKSFANTQYNFSCNLCSENHPLQVCTEFKKLKIGERVDVVKRKGLCFNCLKKNHLVSECKAGNCTICNRRHHTLLHAGSKSDSGTKDNQTTEKETNVKNMHIYDASKVLLTTAMVDVLDENGEEHSCRVLLDSGSQPNIICRDLVSRLGLKKKKLNLSVEVVNNIETQCNEWASVLFKSKNSNYKKSLSFLILPQITGNIPSNVVNKGSLSLPGDLPLADPEYYQPAKIEMLIGAEVFYDLLMQGQIKLQERGIILQNTKLGWVVTGKLGGTWGQQKVRCHLIRNTLNETLEKFWKLEEVGGKIHRSKEETDCEQHFTETFQRTDSGRYMVRLPFNGKQESLGRSYEIARKRFFTLERKLERNLKLKEDYQGFMEAYEDLGHMEQTRSGINEGYYLPHQAVIRESSLTTKLRVVFDASAKTTSGISLNDALMVGPNIQDGIFQLILRCRCHPIVMSGDIEKMYRQFEVHPEDRIYQKILWRCSKLEPLKTYQLKTITYGTSAAPFLATRCLKQLTLDESAAFPLAAKALREDCYMDDLLTGAENLEEARSLRDEIMELATKGGLNLRKWTSNHPGLVEDLRNTNEEAKVKLDPEKTTRTLGVCWNAKEDTLTYEVNISEACTVSKRTILSQVAQLYDPLGLLAPVIIVAKMKLQDLWKLNLDWDDPVEKEFESEWKSYQSQLGLLNLWTIERLMMAPGGTNIQLHGFSDASMKAIGACIYLRVTRGDEYKSILICAKSKVAPIKTVPLPRLELCGAVLLAKLYEMVRAAQKIKIDSTRYWTDSMIVLGWIRSSPHLREIFVANRVSEIQELTKAEDWFHVPTKEKPADFISRGQFPAQFLENEMWKRGPEWLEQKEEYWPNCQMEPGNDLEEESVITLVAKAKERSELWSRYSSFSSLLRVVAYGLRFSNNTRKLTKQSGPLSAEELHQAWRRVITLVQQEEFSEEIENLSKEKEISKKSKIRKLNPTFEGEFLRVGGRVKNADVGFDKKHPIVLPKDHPITDLVILEYHAKMLHGGINATLYAIRDKFWIIDGRVSVRRILHACVRCFRAKPKEVSYLMGDLPKVRLTAARPFENTGVDFCGPFFIKEKVERNRNKVKVYAAIFVCLSTKAVHIELVGNLTSDAFLGCLRRFFARRGKSRVIYSDNGTNFVGAKNELDELYRLLQSKDLNEKTNRFLSNEEIEWHASPPRTPHFGGIWEAAVKSLKHHMRRTVRDTLFSYEELYTYLCEIEAILNSRPLTPMSSDPNDLEVLTPGHFLIGQSFLSIPSPEFSNVKINRLSAWQHIQKLRQDFWKRWHHEYLTELNVRSKWHIQEPNGLKVGSLVVLRDENLPPLRWALGSVLEVHTGDDGIVRVVTIKTENGVCVRGVKKVSPFPIETE